MMNKELKEEIIEAVRDSQDFEGEVSYSVLSLYLDEILEEYNITKRNVKL